MGINLDYYSISLLIGGFTALLSGLVVYIHNHRTTETIAWFFFNISSAVWSFGYFATITATSYEVAFVSDWILHLAAILVPLFCLLSVISITGTYEKHKNGIIIASVTGLIFLISSSSELFVRDVIPKAHFNYVPDAGPLYIAFTIYFFVLVIYVLSVLFSKYISCDNAVEKSRYGYMFLFTLIGSVGGGSVFFLTFNIPLLPYPLILFSLFPVISIYAIFRYRLFNVKVITTEVLVFALWVFIFIRTLVSTNLSDRLVNGGLLLFMIIAGLSLIRSVLKEVRLREEVEKLAEDLKIANQGQSSLIHFMNHQIKGRFGNIKNIFAELTTGDYGVMPAETIPLLEKGLDEANVGVNYVQGILNGASAEKGTISYNMIPLDFRSIVESVFAKQKEHAESRGLEFTLNIKEGSYQISADSVQISEVVRNLLDNSINYTPSGSVTVNLIDLGSIVRLLIKDTGVGLTEDDKTKLFKAGGRGADSLKVNVNATGYGLVFVKGVTDAHKGKVWAESKGRGQGSVFCLELPKIK